VLLRETVIEDGQQFVELTIVDGHRRMVRYRQRGEGRRLVWLRLQRVGGPARKPRKPATRQKPEHGLARHKRGRIYTQGKAAGLSGKLRVDCPYAEQSSKETAWLDGWEEGRLEKLRRDAASAAAER
jgi:ribosome modulation factor